MGLLDDAIKEHLELKRKHGAPEQEVQRQEEEALGPVRREAAQQPESVEAETEASATDGEAMVAEEGVVAETPAPGGEDQLFDGEAQPAEEEVEPAEEPAAEAPAFEESPVAEEAPAPEVSAVDEPVPDPEAPEPVAGPGDTPPRGAPLEDAPRSADPGATVEYDPFADEELEEDEEPAASDDDDEGDGDVLEDTPDFLQETPEHDRLWFEQKPPRDFDFE
jgi:hypothetical protein